MHRTCLDNPVALHNVSLNYVSVSDSVGDGIIGCASRRARGNYFSDQDIGIWASYLVYYSCKVDNRAMPSLTINQHKKKKKKGFVFTHLCTLHNLCKVLHPSPWHLKHGLTPQILIPMAQAWYPTSISPTLTWATLM